MGVRRRVPASGRAVFPAPLIAAAVVRSLDVSRVTSRLPPEAFKRKPPSTPCPRKLFFVLPQNPSVFNKKKRLNRVWQRLQTELQPPRARLRALSARMNAGATYLADMLAMRGCAECSLCSGRSSRLAWRAPSTPRRWAPALEGADAGTLAGADDNVSRVTHCLHTHPVPRPRSGRSRSTLVSPCAHSPLHPAGLPRCD